MNDIRIKDLSLSLDGSNILDNINLNIQSAKITGLIGNNGAGKTSLIKCLTRFYKSYNGSIYIGDKIKNSKIRISNRAHARNVKKSIKYQSKMTSKK